MTLHPCNIQPHLVSQIFDIIKRDDGTCGVMHSNATKITLHLRCIDGYRATILYSYKPNDLTARMAETWSCTIAPPSS